MPLWSIHVVTNDNISFLFVAKLNIYTYIYITHIFFIHSSTNGRLSCFQVLAIVNNAAMGARMSFQVSIFIFFG